MVQKVKKSILKRIEEEFIRTTDTLWENEIQANLFVARILLGTSTFALIAIVADLTGAIGFGTDDNSAITSLILSFIELVIAAGICLYFKGKKKWLKVVMILVYTFACARVESILTSSVTLLMVFPIVVSIRYYSRPVTSATAFFVAMLSGIADYYAIYLGHGRLDLNYTRFFDGTVLDLTNTTLREAIFSNFSVVNVPASWNSYLFSFFVPKFIMFSMVAIICSEIARRGRIAIFDQQAETQKTERISTELNLASDIQANMLPNIFPAFPDRDDFDIYATMTPAKEVGGDFYDFFMVDDKHLALVMADVSGKGIPAAMFMVIAKTLIKDHAQLGLFPGAVFTRVNDLLCEGNEAGLFVTAWMGILDLETGELSYANAGHNPPILVTNGEANYLHSKAGFVLAGLEGYNYQEMSMHLKRGDKIFLYTDGVTEATDINKELYGEDRLINCIRAQKGKSCADVLHAVRADVDEFVGEAEQFDDMTMLAFDYEAKDTSKEKLERTYDATDEQLHNVLAFVEEGLEAHESTMKNTMSLTVAVEEIFVNVAHYAYEEGTGKVTVGMDFEGNDVEIYFIDNGIPFNPLEKEDPDITAKAEDRSIGGLGIYMVKKTMDDCSYERKGNQNIFRMRKAIK